MSYCRRIYAVISFLTVLQFATPLMAETQKDHVVTVKSVNDPKLGQILTDHRGMTLYIFTEDKENSSNCNGRCSTIWPPLLVKGAPKMAEGLGGRIGEIKRNDNSRQVTYNGKPLYYYVKDRKPGDTNGQNVDNTWFVVHP